MSTPSTRLIEREATLVIELQTPLHIGSGEPDGGSDAGVVRDFNGLPGLPGSSIQGMLRAAVTESAGVERAERIFGRTGRANQGTDRGGRLSVSWGMIHDREDQPVNGYLTPEQRDADDVLRDAARPMLRDHVCINDRGVAESRGKFDERVVSAGHRFTVRLRFVTAISGPTDQDERQMNPVDPGEDSDWFLLKSILQHHDLRLGGKTRRGLGAFKVKSWSDDTDPNQQGLSALGEVEVPIPPSRTFSLTLDPQTLWMFGGGTSEDADSAPVSGTRIRWDGANGHGRVEDVWILPGSGIKGPIWHRTMFHANRLAGNWAGETNDDACKKAELWMNQLFGYVSREGARPGKIFIDDCFLPKANLQPAPVQNHVAINPFTGGAKDSALFNDEPLPPDDHTIDLRVSLRGKSVSEDAEPAKEAIEALIAALDDLASGRLALGAHDGRGYGRFRGTVSENPESNRQPEPAYSNA